MAAPQRRWAAELLYVWFHKLRPRHWFMPGPRVDAMLGRRFRHELTFLGSRPAREFLTDPQTALAAVLLFDQLPRNLFRRSARAYAFDGLARAIAAGALDRHWDRPMAASERQFIAMPLMHSECIADQQRCLKYFARLGPRYGWHYARSHYRMIAHFGRFPHRNAVLGRTSTAAEERAVAEGFAW